MFDRFASEVRDLETTVVALAGRLDPDSVPASAAVELFARFDRIARAAAAARTLLARRVEDSLAWQSAGHRSAAEHLAAATGSTLGAAHTELKTSQALRELPATRDALVTGTLSPAQGAAIADAAQVNPAAETDLLGQAATGNLQDLRHAAGRAKAAADPDPAATHARIHRDRRLSRFTDSEGGYNLVARGTADQGAVINAALDPIIDEMFERNRQAGIREGRDTYAFDALVELTRRIGGAKPGKNPNPRFLGLIRADIEALRRGQVEGDELCEITGVGPIPVDVAKGLLGESTLKLVITRGVDVVNVTSLGRGPTAAMKVALAWTSPTCVVKGCSRTALQTDHRIDWAITHHTRLDELEHMCHHDHALKTHHGWSLVHGTGNRDFVPPDHPLHPNNAPPPVAGAPPPPLPAADPIQEARTEIARRARDAILSRIATQQPGLFA